MLFYVHHKVSLEKPCSQSSCRALVTFSHIGRVIPPIEANSNQVNLLWDTFVEHLFLLQSVMVLKVIKVGIGVGRSSVEKSPKKAGVIVADLQEGQAAEMEGGGSARSRAQLEPKLFRGFPSPVAPQLITKEITWSARITRKSWFWMQTI